MWNQCFGGTFVRNRKCNTVNMFWLRSSADRTTVIESLIKGTENKASLLNGIQKKNCVHLQSRATTQQHVLRSRPITRLNSYNSNKWLQGGNNHRHSAQSRWKWRRLCFGWHKTMGWIFFLVVVGVRNLACSFIHPYIQIEWIEIERKWAEQDYQSLPNKMWQVLFSHPRLQDLTKNTKCSSSVYFFALWKASPLIQLSRVDLEVPGSLPTRPPTATD